MSKLERKIRRKSAQQKKKQAEKDMAQKVALFGNLPDGCLICETAFDKNSKEMVQSWYVIVREAQEKVNLYCPGCWERANSLVRKIKETPDEI
jgi:hypothetical protein|tara:strand:- start:1697 stop:1975 length:279 start_codon:yes stop_codon:yes gene_type:complete